MTRTQRPKTLDAAPRKELGENGYAKPRMATVALEYSSDFGGSSSRLFRFTKTKMVGENGLTKTSEVAGSDRTTQTLEKATRQEL